MRCLACNCILKDHEAVRKYADSGEYIDLCDHDYESIADLINVVENEELEIDGEFQDDFEIDNE